MKPKSGSAPLFGRYTLFSEMKRTGAPKSEKLMSPVDTAWYNRNPPRSNDELSRRLYPDRPIEVADSAAIVGISRKDR